MMVLLIPLRFHVLDTYVYGTIDIADMPPRCSLRSKNIELGEKVRLFKVIYTRSTWKYIIQLELEAPLGKALIEENGYSLVEINNAV